MAEMKVSFLGTARAQMDGREIPLPLDAAALLACLLIESEDACADACRSAGVADAAHAAQALNAALGKTVVITSENGVRLAPDMTVRTDLECLQEELPSDENSYHGDFLEGAEGAWVVRRREEYRTAYIEQLRRYIADRWQAHRYGACEKACARMLKLEPLDETAHFHLMKIYELEGEYAKAAELFQRYEAALAENGHSAAGQAIRQLAQSLPQESRTNEILEVMSLCSAVDCN